MATSSTASGLAHLMTPKARMPRWPASPGLVVTTPRSWSTASGTRVKSAFSKGVVFMHRLRVAVAFVVPLLALVGFSVPAAAFIDTTAEHALLMDGDSGQVLWEKDVFSAMPPASMSKLMTIELLFQRLKDGRVKLTDKFPV